MEIPASVKMRLIGKARARHGGHLLPAGTRASVWDSFERLGDHVVLFYNVPGTRTTYIVEESILLETK